MNKKLITLLSSIAISATAIAASNSSATTAASKAPATTSKTNASAVAASSPIVSGVIVKVSDCATRGGCNVISTTTTNVLKIINKRPFSNQAVDAILKTVIPNFDFELMTKLAVGNSWNNASDSQKTKLVSSFKDLLTYTYSAALFKFKGSQITIVSATDEGKKSAVITNVILPNSVNNQPVAVEYDLVNIKKNNNMWKTYDIKIENASLVTTYRNQFAEIIDSNGIDGLISQLESKVEKLRQTKN